MKTIEIKEIHREASFLPKTLNPEERTVEVVWSTGARVFRTPWLSEPYFEELSLDPQHVNLSRLNAGAPLLDTHRDEKLEHQIGVVEKAWIEGKEAKARVKFSTRAEALFNDVAQGIIRNISVGYRIHGARELQRDGDAHKTFLATNWEPHELSFVAVNADPLAQTRGWSETNSLIFRRLDMHQEVAIEETVDHKSLERTRIKEILSLSRKFDLDDSFTDKMIEGNTTIEGARREILDVLSHRSEIQGVKRATFEVASSESETNRAGMINALMHRHDGTAPLTENGKRFRAMNLIDMARASIPQKGFLTKEEVVTRAFHSTSDFPEILGNVAKQKLLTSYANLMQSQNFWALATVRNAPDFKPFRSVRIGEMPSLASLPEGSEYTYGTLGEEAMEWKIGTFGKAMAITRQTIINDDLDVILDVLGRWGAAITRLEAKLFWSTIVNNEPMANGKPLFHKDHNNLTGKDTELSIESLSAARIAMARHQGLDKREGEFLNIQANYLIVAPELQTTAEQFLSREVVPQKPNEVNPFKGAFKIIVTPWFTNPKTWILAASTDQGIDMIEMAYLDGQRQPFVDWKTDFDSDSMRVKARLDFGVKAIDYRGFYKGSGF